MEEKANCHPKKRKEKRKNNNFSTTRPALLVKNFKKIKKELKKTKKIIFFIGT